MKISELENKGYLGNSAGVGPNSFLILNYDTEERPDNGGDDPNPPVTYRVALRELGKFLIRDQKLVTYDNADSKHNLDTLNAGDSNYSSSTIGQFVTANDRTVLDATLTNITYDSNTKKFAKTTRGSTTADVVALSTLLTDMNLNTIVTGMSAAKTLSGLSESGGIISATFQDINILSTQISDRSDSITSTSHDTVATSKAVSDAIASLDITDITNTAGKTIATITETNGKVNATFQDISITSSQINDKGTANCVATLDANGHVPASQLPSYVDDVLEGTLSTFPSTGETGKIYVDTSTNTSYRWSGSQYTKVASDLSLGETSSTAYRGDYGAAAYAHAITNKGSAFASGFYKITTNSEGHVTAATAVTANDITQFLGSAATKNVPTSGNASTTEVVLGNDSRLTDARNAADVSAWAKAATKPTYTASEVGALPSDTEIPDITGLAPLEEPVFTNSITIGSTTLDETQLQSLLALLE